MSCGDSWEKVPVTTPSIKINGELLFKVDLPLINKDTSPVEPGYPPLSFTIKPETLPANDLAKSLVRCFF